MAKGHIVAVKTAVAGFVLKAAALLLVLPLASCYRRPLEEADYSVNVVINIEKEIVNYEYPGDPELMRVAFFDHSTGKLTTQAFLPAYGGTVNVLPGRTYDVLAYNYDTEATYIQSENDFTEILATTNTISDEFKSKLKSRATKTVKSVGEPAGTDVDASSDGSKSDSKDGDDEVIVYDPDHLYVGRLKEVYIPARSVDSPEITLTIDCETVVESWILEVENIKGAQYIGSMSAVITGLSEWNEISIPQRSKDFATVYFDVESIDSEGHLLTRFNTFGQNPESGEKQILSIVITDTAGKGYIFNVDVSDQFPDNEKQYIYVKTDEIEIPEPEKTGSGGVMPSVDEWKDIYSTIII